MIFLTLQNVYIDVNSSRISRCIEKVPAVCIFALLFYKITKFLKIGFVLDEVFKGVLFKYFADFRLETLTSDFPYVVFTKGCEMDLHWVLSSTVS